MTRLAFHHERPSNLTMGDCRLMPKLMHLVLWSTVACSAAPAEGPVLLDIVSAATDGGTDAPKPEGIANLGVGVGRLVLPPTPPWDWIGIIGTGQSLSVGVTAGVVSTSQPFHNLRLIDNGPAPKYPIEPDAGAPQWDAVPLTEPMRASVPGSGPGYGLVDRQYPDNIYGESPHAGMANTLSQIWRSSGGAGEYVTAHTAVGWAAHCLVDLNREGGMRAYPASLNEMGAFHRLAAAAGKTFGVGGIVLTHGECDALNPMYGAGLFQLWQDYDEDLRAITGQTTPPVLFASQEGSYFGGPDGSPVQVWQAGVQHPGQIVCTGPKYQYGYSPDHVHLPAPGYEQLGQKYAEVFDLVVNKHQPWKPLQPTKATLSGKVITIDFDVPNPPLVFDENRPKTMPSAGWANGHGFEVRDQYGDIYSIETAVIRGNSVLLTLGKAPPPGFQLKLAYAITADLNLPAGAAPYRGELRDSDSFVGWDAESIEAATTAGSNVITAAVAGGFARRAAWDIAAGPNVPPGTVVVSHDSDDQLTLSQPVGASGRSGLSFHHDEANFCVHFAMDVQ